VPTDLLPKIDVAPQVDQLVGQLIQQDLADGTAFVSPPIDVDKAQLASLATQTLTHEN
jgi:hypothetical protein